jgi:hypothetical protein
VNNNYFVAAHGVQLGMSVGYGKGGANIVAIKCRFPGTVLPVTRYIITKVSENILTPS